MRSNLFCAKKQKMSANPGDLETSEAFQLAKQLPHGKDRETTVIPASVSFVASRNEELFLP